MSANINRLSGNFLKSTKGLIFVNTYNPPQPAKYLDLCATHHRKMAKDSRVAILGSGNSTGVPWLYCCINPSKRCATCADCLANPNSLNIRNNISALVSYEHPDGRTRHILIGGSPDANQHQ